MALTRSTSAIEYRKLYMTKAWRELRKTILLRDNYLCQRSGCNVPLVSGRTDKRSAVVHHLTPHKGNLELFYDPANLQSVCWSCHSGQIHSEEKLGYSLEIGLDGWPVDDAHPSVK